MITIELLCGADSGQFVRAVVQSTPDQFGADGVALGSWFINGVQAQVEPVSRAWNGKPDTVEVIAIVPNPAPNALATLSVNFQAGVASLPPAVFPSFGGFRLECVDEQNRIYNATLAAGQVVKNGPFQRITRFATTLNGNSRRLLGAIVLVTQNFGSGLVDVEVFMHNGLADPVIGNIFFKSITIFGLNGQTFFPKLCSKRPCGRSNASSYQIASNGAYYWPKQAGLTRRFVVALAGHGVSRRELAYRQGYGGTAFQLDWTDSFGVAKTALGHVTNALRYGTYYGRTALKKEAADQAASLRAALENGNTAEWVGVYSRPFGPFHPFYLDQQGAVSGFWIYHYAGWKQCSEDLAANYLFAAMNVERQPWNAFLAAGRPKTADDFAAEGGGTIQFDFAPFDFSINGIAAFRSVGDYNTGTASRGLDSYPPHDAQHQCRFLKPLQALAYANDYLAKELLLQAAEVDYLYLNLYPQVPGWSGGHNLRTMLANAIANPGQGGLMGRGRCWPIDGIMSFYHLATPAWRTRTANWISKMSECLIRSDMPTGWNNRFPGDGGSQVVVTAGLPTQYDVAQTFEVEFENWAKRSLIVGLSPYSRERNTLNHNMIRSANSFFNTAVYDGSNYKWFMAVGHNHGSAFTPAELGLQSGNSEFFQGWYVLNHAILAARELGQPDQPWVEKALTYRTAVATTTAKLDQLSSLASESWNNHLPQAMGLMANLENEE